MEFVDTVIAQVHARIPHVLVAAVVLDCGEPHQTFLVQVYQQRIVVGHGDVQSQIAFVAVDQQRIIYVLRDDHGLVRENLFWLQAQRGTFVISSIL